MEVPPSSCLPPILVDPVFGDPDLVRRLVERQGPYAPVQRYFGNVAEYEASSGRGAAGGRMLVAPNFRGDWAYDEPLIEGVEPILHHEGFREAAGRLFGSSRVRPQIVYSNLTWQLPFDQGAGHTDVPAFRGFDRTRHPIWLLKAMGDSRLFEEERIRIATAVAWFYQGEDGGFTYWPQGPDAPPKVHEGRIYNTAMVGDNDRMFHRVRPVGARARGMLTDLTLDSRLTRQPDGGWRIEDGGRVCAELPYEELRISVSWKAMVFRDAEEERRIDQQVDELGLGEVVDRFCADLGTRGITIERPSDPVRDPDFVRLLDTAYGRAPSVFEDEAA